MERVVCAAVWLDAEWDYPHQPRNILNGVVVCGLRHHNCLTLASLLEVKCEKSKTVQGFLTSLDRFVGREEAAGIAFRAGQVLKDSGRLMSEDLY